MGMFDWLQCKMPLPGGPVGENGFRFQTKHIARARRSAEQSGEDAFACGGTLDTYTIDEQGVLWGEDYDLVDRSEPGETGLKALAGSLVRENVRPVRLDDFSGRVVFYTDYGVRDRNGRGGRWVEYDAEIENGRVKTIRLVEDTANPFV